MVRGNISKERRRAKEVAIQALIDQPAITNQQLVDRFKIARTEACELRKLVETLKPELDWFRENEPAILDIIRTGMVKQFIASLLDPNKKWTTVDYAILVDKARLLRGESTLNLSGLSEVVQKAEEAEMARFKRLAEESKRPEKEST